MPEGNAFSSIRIPKFQGRRALLVLNCQKDAFNSKFGFNITNPPDFLDRIRNIIPYYRKLDTEIVWVQTEVAPAKTDTDDRAGDPVYDLHSYMPSSVWEHERPNLNEADKAKRREKQESHWRQESDSKLPIFRYSNEGTAVVDKLADMFDPEKDILITKHFYSAFDETPLLMGLRMKMVTDVHLCGGLSNVTIIYTAAEAAQHGFQVSVVEDCMGYRLEEQHLEAMQKMADEIGVSGVDSEEIVTEAGGIPPPDADPDIFSGPGFSGINISSSMPEDVSAALEDMASPIGVRTRPSKQLSERGQDERAKDEAGRNKIGEGDSKVISNALSPGLATTAFEKLKAEVNWQSMKHRTGDVPRLVAVQGDIGPDGAVPVYRHPADECPPLTPYSPTVAAICAEVSALLDQPFNHVLIQLYRSGTDNISEHSDKTLDIARGTPIVNVSLGAQRKMTLRIKKSALSREQQARGDRREGQRITLPHNSVFVLGPKTNARWLHGVRPDKRMGSEKTEAETAFGGERVSLTFRTIATFTDARRRRIWGQGARRKAKEEEEEVAETHADAEMQVGSREEREGWVRAADSEEAERMVVAFGRENHQVDFDWEKEYGEGFDALDLVVVNGTGLVG